MTTRSSLTNVVCCAGLALLALAAPAQAADLVVIGVDPPGVGTNDPTPVAPVGGNPGTTLGEQRLNVYEFAADLWGSVLESDVTIYVSASFTPLTCTPTSGVLGSAGTTFIVRDFPGAPFAGTWYTMALSDALAGIDNLPGNFDIASRFNSLIDDDPNCLVGSDWYYGLDHGAGTDFDFLNVVMHEIAHGLGFANATNEATGAFPQNLPSIYDLFTLDLTTGKTWNIMTDAERVASAVNSFNVVWDGAAVTNAAPNVLGPRPSVQVLRPQDLKDSYEAEPAAFGAPLDDRGGTTGQLVLVDDGTGTATDACEPIVNDIHGKIALVDRGTCAFVIKVAYAQAAGAKGVIVANNQPKGLLTMGGADPTIEIPAVMVTRDNGDLFKAHLPGVNVKLIIDEDVQSGTTEGYVRLYAPDPVALGSSISHWDTTATPNLLMEPFINSDLRASETLDLTPSLFEDIGWTLTP